MFLLGLTGSIGMGKSTTAGMFADEGCAVWDADAAVHRLYAECGAAVPAFTSAFPEAVIGGVVSRAELKRIIAGDPDALRRIEGIVHPLVAQDRAAFLATAKADIAVLDIPLLFETGGEAHVDAVACVLVSPKVQERRVLERGTMTRAQFETIRDKQMPAEEKARRADYVIETDTFEHARAQVQRIVAEIGREWQVREIVLDTETTGFDPETGDRIVEIGAIELIGHVPTGQTYHQYINPERAMPDEAFQVHGLGDDFLRDKPKFAAIGQAFIDFIGESKLVIHNAAFDIKFLNAELKWMNQPQIPWERAVDTLAIARRRFPGSPGSLDALCRRFGIDNSARTLHGALLDSEILAEVYLELIGGRQPDFVLSSRPQTKLGESEGSWTPPPRPHPLPSRLSEAEAAAHAEFVGKLGSDALWLKV